MPAAVGVKNVRREAGDVVYYQCDDLRRLTAGAKLLERGVKPLGREKPTKARRRTGRVILLWGVGIAAAGCSLLTIPAWLLIAWDLSGIHYTRQTENFHKQMQREADITAIREWALAYDHYEWGRDVPTDQWPPSITELNPGSVRFDPRIQAVTLFHLAGFRNVGLTIGPKGSLRYAKRSIRYVIELDDGAWVWHP